MIEPVYVLNQNEGVDTVHRSPLEQCNLDDSKDRQVIDPDTAEALINHGDAVACRHCFATEETA